MATEKQNIRDTLYCPRCFSQIIRGEGYRTYQTLVDHVFSPNSPAPSQEYFICSNKDCPTRIDDDFWDWYGDFYYSGDYNKDFFYLDCNKALNSGSRQFNLQCKKKDVTILHLILFKIYIEFTPLYDPMGMNRTGYSHKIKMCYRKYPHHNWMEYIPGIHMFFFCLRSFEEDFNRYIKDPSNKYNARELLRELEVESWDKRWWKRLSRWYNNLRTPGLRKLLIDSIKD